MQTFELARTRCSSPNNEPADARAHRSSLAPNATNSYLRTRDQAGHTHRGMNRGAHLALLRAIWHINMLVPRTSSHRRNQPTRHVSTLIASSRPSACLPGSHIVTFDSISSSDQGRQLYPRLPAA